MTFSQMLRPAGPRLRLVLAGVLCAGGLSACKDASEPAARQGTIAVRAYVDRDASGTFTSGDSALAGVQIRAERDGAAAVTQTTNDEGLVRFTAMDAGTYRIAAAGGQLPAGAALASNPEPTAAVTFLGDTSRVEFRYVFFPGTVSGRVFREDNGVAGYQQGGDTPGAGLIVQLLADSTDATGAPIPSNQVLATTTTDANGAYTFNLVKLGNYYVRIENPTTISFGTAGNTRRVTVAPQQTATVAGTTFTGSLVLTIAQARTKTLGSVVAVEGVISTPPGPFATTNNRSEVWIQDATGGIAVFSVPTDLAATYPLGKRVRVSGTLGANGGQLQINVPSPAAGTAPPQVELLTGTGAVTATAVTGAQVNALGANEGRLVSLSGFRVTTVGTPNANGQFNVTGTTPDGQTVTLRIIGAGDARPTVGNATGLRPSNFVPGARYTITGELTRFESGTPVVVTAQLKPRFTTDVVLEAGSPAKLVINELMPDPAGSITDDVGEYFEIYNAGGTAANLRNYTFRDNSAGNVHLISSDVIVQPGGYVLFGASSNPANFGGRTPDYVYPASGAGNVALNNGTDLLKLIDPTGVTVDSVFYSTRNIGASWSLRDPSADNADVNGPNWQAATTVYDPANNNRGTPGAQNDGFVAPTAAPAPPKVPAITAATRHAATRRRE